MVMVGAVDFAGLALTALSVAVPAVLSLVFYIIVAAAPGGIRRGSHGHCRLLQRTGQRAAANNHVKPDSPEAVPNEIVEEVIEEVVEEIAVEEPPEATENFVEEIPEVAHPEPAVQSSKKKKKKNKAKEAEEVVEEIEPAVETVEVAEEDLPLEEPVADEELPMEASGEDVDNAALAEAEQVEAEQAEEDATEAVEAIEEVAHEVKGKKKKNKKKPNAAFLLAQQFRCGVDVPEEPATVKAEFELDPSILMEEGDEGDWVTLTKKEKKAEKKEEEVETPEPAGATETQDEEEEHVEETMEEAPDDEEEAADEDLPEDDAAAEEVVAEEEAEKDDEEEDDEDATGEAGAAEDDAGEVAADEEEAGEGLEDEEEEDADDEDGEEFIDVPFKCRQKVREHKKLIAEKTSVKPITEIGGTFTVKGPRAARKEALIAIESIATKGYTLLSYPNPKEAKLDVQAGKLSLLIGPKGAVINKIREACGVEVKIPEQADVPADRSALCPVFVGGSADGVDEAAQVVTEIVESGFSPLTHPGVVREERDLDKFEKGFVIGKSGAEVNKIKESFKVRVSVQDDKAYVTGQKKDVANAMKHIQTLLSRDDVVKKIEALREKEAREAEAAAKAAADAEAAAKAEQEEEEEEEATGDNEEADGEDKEIEAHEAAKDESEEKEDEDEEDEEKDDEDEEEDDNE